MVVILHWNISTNVSRSQRFFTEIVKKLMVELDPLPKYPIWGYQKEALILPLCASNESVHDLAIVRRQSARRITTARVEALYHKTSSHRAPFTPVGAI